MASIPFVVYGVFRYLLLVHRDGGDNPDVLLLQDRPLQIALLLWLAVVMAVIYLFSGGPTSLNELLPWYA
jgi:ABC-type phosphate transport system permease subunit